jgi:uncharacterized protein YndB with AHSA1/START domain
VTVPATTLAFHTELVAAPERVFAALTEARHIERWFCDAAVSVPRPGGALSFAWRRPGSSLEPYVGRWETFDPPCACTYSGGHSGYPDGDAGVIAYSLAPLGSGTRLTTLHTLPDRPEYEPIAARYRDAWPRALARLAAYLGGATP